MKKDDRKLISLQQAFTSHLINEKKLNIIDSLPYSKQEALARLNIYRNNVIGNFESVLSSIFEVTKKIVGDNYFDQLVQLHIKSYPSTSGNLDLYGSNFPKLIKRKLKEHTLLYLEDVAKLELFYHQSYFAKDVTKAFNLAKFQTLSEDKYQDLRFKLHPSCFLISSKFPIFTIWKNNIEDSKKRIKIANNPEYALISRVGDSSIINKLSHEEFLFLTHISEGKKLYETYEKITRKTKKEIDIGALLNNFISTGIFINFKTH